MERSRKVSFWDRPYRYVRSSYGDIRIDHDGTVLEICWCDKSRSRYIADTVRFDIAEYHRYYGKIDREYDILDLGYWDKRGRYVPPHNSYRGSLDDLEDVIEA